MVVCDFVLIDNRRMLRDHLPLLEEGVAAVTDRDIGESLAAADVYMAAVDGGVSIRLVRVDEQVEGFLVTHVVDAITGERSLYVWLLYLRPGISDVMKDVVEELELMAHEHACTCIEFTTSRAAWRRRLACHGFEPQAIQFKKEVTL